jgi:hypothetical protein
LTRDSKVEFDRDFESDLDMLDAIIGKDVVFLYPVADDSIEAKMQHVLSDLSVQAAQWWIGKFESGSEVAYSTAVQ